MNETIETILNRRSVRVYGEDQIQEDDLELILKAGLYAPSACNSQPWHFTIVQDQELIKAMSDDAKKEFVNSENEQFRQLATNERYDIFHRAPTIIIVSGEKTAISPVTDTAAAIENMLLAADSLNIGTCWIGLIRFLFQGPKAQEYIEKLQIPEGFEPYYAVTFGYIKHPNPKPQPRRENTVTYIR